MFELAVLENIGTNEATGYHLWAAAGSSRAQRFVSFRDPRFVAAEQFASRIESTILGYSEKCAEVAEGLCRALFELLFEGASADLYKALPGDSNVTLGLLSQSPRVLRLPWEYLCAADLPVMPNILRPLVRIVPMARSLPPPRRPAGRPLRILFLAAEPKGWNATQWQREASVLEEEIKEYASTESETRVTVLAPATKERLRAILQVHSFDVVHFSGHGTSDGIVLSGAGNKEDVLTANDLEALVHGRGIQLMVLSACRTATGGFDKEFAVLAPGLVRVGIPAVVAMQYSISSLAAIEFVGTLYRQLHEGRSLDHALIEARLTLFADLGKDAPEWGVPVLYRTFDAVNPLTPAAG